MSSGTILIVEDDSTYRTTVIRHLRRLQFTVAEAVNLEQALNNIERYTIDLVILDVGLGKRAAFEGSAEVEPQPGGSGYALLDIIRSRPRYIPVIILTSLDEPIYEVACLQRGADDFLRKRIDLEVLAAHVQACIRRVKVLRDGESQNTQGSIAKPTNDRGRDFVGSVFQSGDFTIDVIQRLVQVCGGAHLHLTEREVRMLKLMAEAPGKVSTNTSCWSSSGGAIPNWATLLSMLW
jgi:DNA-binding response OmpR family regulator